LDADGSCTAVRIFLPAKQDVRVGECGRLCGVRSAERITQEEGLRTAKQPGYKEAGPAGSNPLQSLPFEG